jgi:hypothetical protein
MIRSVFYINQNSAKGLSNRCCVEHHWCLDFESASKDAHHPQNCTCIEMAFEVCSGEAASVGGVPLALSAINGTRLEYLSM